MAATRQGRGKRYLLDSAWAVKLFTRLIELSWSDVRDICASSRHCLLTQKKKSAKITEYRDTAPLSCWNDSHFQFVVLFFFCSSLEYISTSPDWCFLHSSSVFSRFFHRIHTTAQFLLLQMSTRSFFASFVSFEYLFFCVKQFFNLFHFLFCSLFFLGSFVSFEYVHQGKALFQCFSHFQTFAFGH